MLLTAVPGIVEQILRLINNLIEGTPMEQRKAQALQWFWMWWPFAKLFLSSDQQKQVEDIMKDPKT